jgi:hypothetical protein
MPRAFYDETTYVLTSWGYQETNCRIGITECDPHVEVPWDFDLEVGKWRLVDGEANPPTWEPYPPPAE